MLKKTLVTIVAIVLCVSLFAACSTTTETASTEAAATTDSSASFTLAADIEVPDGKTALSLPVDEVSEEPIKIATVMVQNNAFGIAVLAGQNWAKEVLADRNCIVDCISVEDFEAESWNSTIESLVAADYDAITFFGLSESLTSVTEKGIENGIVMLAFNTAVGEPNAAEAFYGQDGFYGGQQCAEALIEAMGGSGEYGIITGDFSVLGHELRRTGARDIFDQNSDMILVGEYENNDKTDEAYTITTNLITANPNLTGIYVTAGGPSGAAKAIEDAEAQGIIEEGQVKLVCHDVLEEVAPYIESGLITACLDQDPFNQGAQPVIDAYNYIVAGVEIPEETYYEGAMATPDNVTELFPELF